MSFIAPVQTDTNGNAKATGAQKELGKDEFLQLMVAKLEYQDPLNPMADEDYIAQLAQFSSLEQMSNIATAIEDSNQMSLLQMQALSNTMAADLIGKDIKAEFDGAYVSDGEASSFMYTNDQFASEVNISIKNADGTVIRTLSEEDVDTGSHTVTWDGKDSHGNKVQDGYYYIDIAATDASGDSFDPKMAFIGQVDSVLYRDGAAYLNVGGVELSLGDITAVGEPGAFTNGDEG